MTAAMPKRAMVLAAGLGERLRPITDRTPKPLVAVDGVPMIDRALDLLNSAGVETVVVNTHHLADRIEAHLAGRTSPKIAISREDRLLDTGGGVANALDRLGDGPFFVMNGDVLILNGLVPALARLAAAWCDEDMDALLLVQATVRAYGYAGFGDFTMRADGRLDRRRERWISPYLFAGVQMLHPRLFEGCPDGAFSLNRLYDKAAEAGRLFGVVHDGVWMHIGTPDALENAERFLKDLD